MVNKTEDIPATEEPVFEADDLFKAMRCCVIMLGAKNIHTQTARLGIPAKVIKNTPDDASMTISYDAEGDSFVFEVPITIKRKRGIIQPSKKLILPGR
jgi:hypothetical protein